MPNLMVIDPCDALEIEQAIPQIAAHNGPVYAFIAWSGSVSAR
jgi:transketolase